MNHSQIVSFIWGVADLIRDTFKRGKYQDVILPLTVLRRLDCVLAPSKLKVMEVQARYQDKIENPKGLLQTASGFAFYNTSRYDFAKLLADAPHIAQNLRNYIAGFSPNMREVLEKFDFDNTIAKLDEAGLLFQVMQRFGDPKVNLHPDAIDNFTMGTIFEELIRKFNEALKENPGEHFTPRDVVHLMVDLLLAGDEERLRTKGVVLSVCDPCCGSGGMLTIAKEHVTVGERRDGEPLGNAVNPDAGIHLFGQEVNPETFAVCKSDLFMKSKDSRDADEILFGSTLSNDRHAGTAFDYMIANPPYGKDWKRDQDAVGAEHDRGAAGRFGPGLPRISDGQLLFLLHMLAHAKDPAGGGSRIAIIMNGSPLFTGDAGSGESEIRRWILENDWLEALIALPEQLFYNTGIATYVWVLTNRKRPERRGRVQLIDATAFWVLLRKSLGAKRRQVPFERKQDILRLLAHFEDGATRKIVRDGEEHEARRQPRLPHRALRLPQDHGRTTAQARFPGEPRADRSARRRARFRETWRCRAKRVPPRPRTRRRGREQQAAIQVLLGGLPDKLFLDRAVFEDELTRAAQQAKLKLAAPIRKAILSALSERNEKAEICRDREGCPEPDPELRDTENVPLLEDVETFFEREVKPHVPDAWIDTTRRDPQDGKVGLVGYEINFNRYFYQYRPPRPLEEIEADIQQVEKEILAMLREVAG